MNRSFQGGADCEKVINVLVRLTFYISKWIEPTALLLLVYQLRRVKPIMTRWSRTYGSLNFKLQLNRDTLLVSLHLV